MRHSVLLPAAAAALVLSLARPVLAQDAPAPAPSSATPAPAPKPAPTTEMAPGAPIAVPVSPIALPTIPGDTGHFEFGSYGRVQFASDGRGGTGREANVVAHGDRIDEDSYAELELRREDQFAPGVTSKVVMTLGLLPALLPLLGRPVAGHRHPQPVRAGHLRRPDPVGRLAHVPRRRHLPARLVAARQPEHRRRRRRLQGALDHATRRPSRRTSACSASTRRYQYEQIPAPVPSVLAAQAGPSAVNVTVLDRPRTIETLQGHAPVQARQPRPDRRLQARPLRRGARALGRRVHRHLRQPSRADRAARRTRAGWSAPSSRTGPASATPSCSCTSATPRASPPTTRLPCRSRSPTTAPPPARPRTLVALGGNYEVGPLRPAGRRLPPRLPRRRSQPHHVAEVRRGHPRRPAAALPGRALRRRARGRLRVAPLRRDRSADRRAADGLRVALRCHPLLLAQRPRLVQAPAAARSSTALTARNAAHARALPRAGRLQPAHRRAVPRPGRRVVVQLVLVPVRIPMATPLTPSPGPSSLATSLGAAHRARVRVRLGPRRRHSSPCSPPTCRTGATRSSTSSSSTASPTAT